jgi:hypothetical protein
MHFCSFSSKYLRSLLRSFSGTSFKASLFLLSKYLKAQTLSFFGSNSKTSNVFNGIFKNISL